MNKSNQGCNSKQALVFRIISLILHVFVVVVVKINPSQIIQTIFNCFKQNIAIKFKDFFYFI